MWIIYRSNKDKSQTLMLDTHQFRQIGGMPYPFDSLTEAKRELERFCEEEPDWNYEVREFNR